MDGAKNCADARHSSRPMISSHPPSRSSNSMESPLGSCSVPRSRSRTPAVHHGDCAAVDVAVHGQSVPEVDSSRIACMVRCTTEFVPLRAPRIDARETEWILLTSGTSGVPKMVVQGLSTLTAPTTAAAAREAPVWATFYDIRRYGGLQILLRALLGGGSPALSDATEPTETSSPEQGRSA